MKRVLFLVFASLLFLAAPVRGQVVLNEFTTYTNLDVFPYKVYDLVEDADGFLWIATDSGLMKSDGKNFTRITMTTDEKHKIPTVFTMQVMKDGHDILFGTAEGLFYYNARSETVQRSPLLSGRKITAILVEGSSVCVGTMNGLYVCRNSDGHVPDPSDLVRISPEQYVTSCRMIGGDCYVGSFDGLAKVDSAGQFVDLELPMTTGKSKNAVLDILEDPYDKDILWLATLDGLLRYHVQDHHTESFFRGRAVGTLAICRKNLWVGTDGGLYIMDARRPSETSTFIKANHSSLPSNTIYKVFENKAGDIFVGTDIGLSHLNHTDEWIKYNIERKDSPLVCTNCFAYDEDYIYIGTQNGVYAVSRISSSSIRRIYPNPDAPRAMARIRDLTIQEGVMWMTSDAGVDGLDLVSGQVYSLEFNLPDLSQHIVAYSTRTDFSGRIWMTTSRGIFVLTENDQASDALLVDATAERGIPDAFQGIKGGASRTGSASRKGSASATGSASRTGVASGTGGASRTGSASGTGSAERGKSPVGRRYECRRILKDEEITDVRFLENMAVAIGQGDAFVIDPRSFYTASRINGYNVRSMSVCAGTIWFAGRNGLYYLLDYTRLQHVEGNDNEMERLCVNDERIYAMSGLEIYEYLPVHERWRSFTISDIPVTSMTPFGRDKILLGSLDCFYLLDLPSAFKKKDLFPLPTLTGLTIDNQKVSPGQSIGGKVVLPEQLRYLQEIVLPKDINSFSLAYTIPDFHNQPATFAYRLTGNGREEDWQYTKAHKAIFSDLPAGRYRFELTSSFSDFQDKVSLDVRVRTKWYRSKVVRALSILALLVLLWGIVWYIRMQRQLKAANKEKSDAMKVVREKKDFLEALSCEMTAPLTTLVNQLGTISSRPFCELDAEQLQSMNRNAEQMQTLLQKMEAMNEASSGELFIPSPTDLNVLVREIWNEFRPRMLQKNIDAQYDTCQLDWLFMLDRVKIRVALGHLLDNAIKFTPAGGRITLRLETADLGDELLEARISITDTGRGMSEESLTLACNKYYTGKEAGADAGAGLGLWIAGQTARQHDGRLELRSEPGKGTTALLALQTYRKASLALHGEDTDLWQRFNIAWKHNRKACILFISSEASFLEAMVGRLSEHMNVLTAGNPEICQEVAQANVIDLILYDFTSMGETGDLWSRVRDWCHDPIIPLVGITDAALAPGLPSAAVPGPETAGYAPVAVAVHCDRVISKPVSLKQLTDSVLWAILKHEKNLETMRKEQLTSPQEEQVESPEEKFLREMMAIIEENIDNPDFSVERLCEASHYSNSQIYRNIKQICGMTVVEFIRDVRLKKAASYLRQGKLTVNEIMYMSGFTSRTYFFRRFKEKFGLSPSEYAAKFGTTQE